MNEKKILIIDDDPNVLLLLATRLKGHGYKVISATDGIQAITLALKEIPDLVILDLGLPAGDGFHVLERMRNLTGLTDIPVVVLSARDAAVNQKRALNAGAIAYLQKPPENREFLGVIKHALGEESALSSFLKT